MTARLKLDQDLLALSMIVERQTGVQVKDCFKDDVDTLYFVVAQGQIGKAVGKGGANIKGLQQNLNKNVRFIEYREPASEFIRSIIYPITIEEIKEEGGIVTLKDSNRKTKSLLIGREGRNLQLLNRAVKRFFNVEVKVV
ncbi:NusA-like transcription termination signal-binding factor [Candidatus Woesearchaeota archaeon]|nr:NusA-like transcription termination signal-binding factor [Candidatus Woesearchaeota archaeon]